MTELPQNVTNDVVDPNPDNRMEAIELHENETDSHGNQCEVANVDSNQSEPLNIPDTDKSTKEDVSNETLDDLKNNPNVKILGVATVDPFDETVEYALADGSHSTSSGSSPHSDDDTANHPPIASKLYTLPLKHYDWVQKEKNFGMSRNNREASHHGHHPCNSPKEKRTRRTSQKENAWITEKSTNYNLK